MFELSGQLVLANQKIVNVHGAVAPKETVALFGPSGCGKTTLLRAILGFYPISTTKFFLDNRNLALSKPTERWIGICFQEHTLLPQLNVFQNLELPLKFHPKWKSFSRSQRKDKVELALESCGLSSFAFRDPLTLSGGEARRISVLRAIICEPELILLDEPSVGLDHETKEFLKEWLNNVLAEQKSITIIVTHDEAFVEGLATRIARWDVTNSCIEF